VIDKPYQFVPPRHGSFWPWIAGFVLRKHLRKTYGVTDLEFRGLESLRASINAGHGILLTPNHCHDADPLVIGELGKSIGKHLFLMASWHLFMQENWMSWPLPRIGAFSVYREGMDRTAVNTAIEILETAERPLVIFPEGVITRTNDRLNALLEG